jgi:hypothetical protein
MRKPSQPQRHPPTYLKYMADIGRKGGQIGGKRPLKTIHQGTAPEGGSKGPVTFSITVAKSR